MSYQVTNAQAAALIYVLQDHVDGEPVMFTFQGDGSLVVAFNLATVTIDRSGIVESNYP
jgi:hypothetical protein